MKQSHYCQRKLKQEYCQFIRKNPEAAINFCLPNQANITNKGKNIHIFTKGSSFSAPSLYYLVKTNLNEIEVYHPSAFKKLFQISSNHRQLIVEQMIQLEMEHIALDGFHRLGAGIDCSVCQKAKKLKSTYHDPLVNTGICIKMDKEKFFVVRLTETKKFTSFVSPNNVRMTKKEDRFVLDTKFGTITAGEGQVLVRDRLNHFEIYSEQEFKNLYKICNT